MRFDNVLVVAAHPDDEVLGVGGTIPLITRNGGRVTVVIVTDGSTTQYRSDTVVLEEKQADARRANDVLGTDRVIQWSFPDMRLDTVAHCELNDALEGLVASERFDAVFVHHDGDVNIDHAAIYRSTLVAVRPYPGQPVKAVFTYPVVSSTEWGGRREGTVFVPNFFVDIAETLEQKLKAMACYTSELRDYPHPRSLEALRQRAAVYGTEVGCHYAEAFRLLLFRGNPLG